MSPFNNTHFLLALFHPLILLLSLEGKGPSGSVCILSWFTIKSEHHFFFFNTQRMLSYFSLPGNLPLSPSPSLSPHLPLLLWRSHCSSAGHKCTHRSFNRQLNQKDSPTISCLPCWDPEKLLKGGRDVIWIHFPCDRVGCSLWTQHRQLPVGILSLAL